LYNEKQFAKKNLLNFDGTIMNSWQKDLEQLVMINSYTKNKAGVDKVGHLIAEKLLPLGFTCKRFPRQVIGDHLFFISQNRQGENILLLGHMDTVFPPDTFETYSYDKKWVYGPGVCDMKGGLVVAIKALESIYAKFGKIYNIDFLFVSDEETGSDDSKSVTAKIAKEYKYAFIFEAAGKNDDLVVGRKGIGTFYLDIQGKASHAGVAFEKGNDANLEAAYKLIELSKLTNLKKGSTVNVGKINGGIGANTISPHNSLVFETRFKTVEEKERILKKIKEISLFSFIDGTNSTLSGGLQRDVMEPNEKQKTLIQFFETLTEQKLPQESRGGVSDANITASVGTLSIDGFGPFGDGDHTNKERALMESFESRIRLCEAIFTYHQDNNKLL
jgi:glutamate carboxypeptidase